MEPEDTKVWPSGFKITKVRKPVIEKMRRDRINHSIEQLRVLLERDVQLHHQHSKLEKADILEMAVTYLQRHKMHLKDSQNSQRLYYLGYYMCLKETVGFLHSHGHTQGKELPQSHAATGHHYPESSATREHCDVIKNNSNIWRPW